MAAGTKLFYSELSSTVGTCICSLEAVVIAFAFVSKVAQGKAGLKQIWVIKNC